MFVTTLEARTLGRISVIGRFRLVRTVQGLQARQGARLLSDCRPWGATRFMSRGMTDEVCL